MAHETDWNQINKKAAKAFETVVLPKIALNSKKKKELKLKKKQNCDWGFK